MIQQWFTTPIMEEIWKCNQKSGPDDKVTSGFRNTPDILEMIVDISMGKRIQS
jgi:hypothetical protein